LDLTFFKLLSTTEKMPALPYMYVCTWHASVLSHLAVRATGGARTLAVGLGTKMDGGFGFDVAVEIAERLYRISAQQTAAKQLLQTAAVVGKILAERSDVGLHGKKAYDDMHRPTLEPSLRLLNLQLPTYSASVVIGWNVFRGKNKYLSFQNVPGYSWRCNSRS
jgi:hypothetical protein